MSNCAEGIQDSGFETEFVSIGTIPLSLPENESWSIDYGMNERRKEEREREVRMRGKRRGKNERSEKEIWKERKAKRRKRRKLKKR